MNIGIVGELPGTLSLALQTAGHQIYNGTFTTADHFHKLDVLIVIGTVDPQTISQFHRANHKMSIHILGHFSTTMFQRLYVAGASGIYADTAELLKQF